MWKIFLAFMTLASLWGAPQFLRWYRSFLPNVEILKTFYPVPIRREGEKILFRLDSQRQKNWKNLNQISKFLISAVLIAEDSGFYQHPGYEAGAIRDAWRHNLKPGVKIKRGGSTITQQLVKNIFLTQEKKISRKIRELILAAQLERALPKAKILELYLNVVEWGPETFGVAKAAMRYFQKSPEDLTPKESAILAFLLPNPQRYGKNILQGNWTAFTERRVQQILDRMLKVGRVKPEDLEEAQVEAEEEKDEEGEPDF